MKSRKNQEKWPRFCSRELLTRAVWLAGLAGGLCAWGCRTEQPTETVNSASGELRNSELTGEPNGELNGSGSVSSVVPSNPSVSTPPGMLRHSHGSEGIHEHPPGPRGGVVVPLDRHQFYVETVFRDDAQVVLYLLQDDQKTPKSIPQQALSALVSSSKMAGSLPMTMESFRQANDPIDETSGFIGTLPKVYQGGPVDVIVPELKIENQTFRVWVASPAK